MRDLVSERRRGRYFGYRTQVTTISTFVALVIAGVLLHGLDTAGATYRGFVLIFLVAFVARLVSVYHLTFLYEPAVHDPVPDMHIEHWWRSLLSTGAIGFSTYFALMNAAVGISAPFFTVYMLRDLRLSYLEFTALSGTSVIVQFLMLSTWGRIADVYGNRLDADRHEHLAADRAVALAFVGRLPLAARLSSRGRAQLVGVHAELRQPALRARAAHAARGLRCVSQRGHGVRRVRGRDARRRARRGAAAARRAARRYGP